MARFVNPTRAQKKAWRRWVASRPEAVRLVAQRFEPWSLYRLGSTGQRVTVCGFDEQEDGTVTVRVTVTGEFNQVLFDRAVFGINPNDLTPCDLPANGEELGAVLDQDQVEDNIDILRAAIRPDLWALDENGKAVRKM